MDKERQAKYIEHLQRLIRIETVSDPECGSSAEAVPKTLLSSASFSGSFSRL